jgi:hypothetical protein
MSTLHTKQNTLNTLYSIGQAGQTLTAGANGTSWITANTSSNTQTQFNGGSGKPVMTIPYGEDKVILEKDAALEVKGKVVINGLDLEERLKTIEKVLMIPERDATIEAKYPSLKKKFDEYINALEKYKTFERVKGTYDK